MSQWRDVVVFGAVNTHTTVTHRTHLLNISFPPASGLYFESPAMEPTKLMSAGERMRGGHAADEDEGDDGWLVLLPPAQRGH